MDLDELRRAAAILRSHASPPWVVETKQKAEELTENDPIGHEWQVGEEYYQVDIS